MGFPIKEIMAQLIDSLSKSFGSLTGLLDSFRGSIRFPLDFSISWVVIAGLVALIAFIAYLVIKK